VTPRAVGASWRALLTPLACAQHLSREHFCGDGLACLVHWSIGAGPVAASLARAQQSGAKRLGQYASSAALVWTDATEAMTQGEGAQRRSFTTLVKHRTVREGGGIEPDVSLPAPQPSEIEIQLQDQETYENFASFWQRSHPLALAAPSKEAKEAPKGVVVGAQPAPPSGSMAVDDTVFNAFLDFVERKGDSGFEARTRFDPYLKQLAAAMKKEGLEDMAAKTQVLTQSAQSTLRQGLSLSFWRAPCCAWTGARSKERSREVRQGADLLQDLPTPRPPEPARARALARRNRTPCVPRTV